MAWSKVSKEHTKPWKWWVHKACCEWGWFVRSKDHNKTYYHHLAMCFKYGYNIYGEKINNL